MGRRCAYGGLLAAARTRLTVDVDPELRRRLRLVAARRDGTVTEYVRRVLERALEEDLPPALYAEEDPVLAELWDNDADAVYDDA